MIDMHAHMIPPVYREILAKHDALYEDGFPTPDWSPEAHLAYNEKAGIDRALLTTSSPHPYFGDAAEIREVCRAINEYGADLKRKYPASFGYAATLPLPDVEGAVKEAIYAFDCLDADAVKLASNSRGLYLGEPALDPLMEELNRRKAILIIHPHRPEPIKEGVFSAGPVPLYEFLADTTRAVLNLIAFGTTAKYPDIRIVVPHCGSFLPNIHGRLAGIGKILVPLGKMPDIDVPAEFARLYFDCAGSPVPYLLDLLEHFAASDHVMLGTDYPYTPTEMALNNTKALREFLRGREDEASVLHAAAENLWEV